MNIFRGGAVVLLSLVGFAGLAGEANAQMGGGRSGMSTGDRQENIDAFSELSVFGRCFALSNRRDAFTLIATAPGSPEERAAFDRLVFGEQPCLAGGSGTRVQASIIYMRGVIAEALLEMHADVPAGLLLPAPALAEVRDLGGVARCYAAGHRPQVQALVATRAGSAEELAAVSALWNDFRTCLPRQFNIRLNAQWIRFLLAEAMLRLAPPAPTSS